MRNLSWPLLAVTLISAPASAQVLITEVQPNPNGSDDAEWIEIHNAGGSAADISGWTINDFGPSTPRVYAFPTGTILAANEVIIVARQATTYITMSTTEGYAVTTPDFELAEGADEAGVPNLTVLVSGTGGLALGNSGDGVQISDSVGTVMSTAEWGNGRTEIPGNAAAGPGSGESIGRIATTGSSDVDFAVQSPPNPGVGYAGAQANPPTISNEMRSPSHFVYGSALGVSADVLDADGVLGVEVYFATATSPTGPASSAYVASSASAAMNTYSVAGTVASPVSGVSVPAPTAFNQQYIRYFVYALDNATDEGTSPANATTDAANANYYWENVLPPTGLTPLSTARAEDAMEWPIWINHSVRIEGVALTTSEAFITGRTNFFIADPSTGAVEAVRIFDDELLAAPINPGDRVVVEGKVGVYRGVRQVGRDERGGPGVAGPEITVQVTGTAPVPMHTVTVAQLLAAGEQYESSLVEIVNASFVGAPPSLWSADTNVDISDGTGTLTLRVVGVTDLPNTAAPTGTFTVRGILTQFAPTGTGGYQLQPRGIADVIPGMTAVDGGVVTPDSGTVTPDSGTTTPDSGTVTPDSGTTTPDSGTVTPDSGTTTPDSGTVTPDAGANVDAGFDTDAGVAPTDGGATTPTDSGTFGTRPGGTGSRDTGCTCAAPADRAPFGLVGLLAVGLLVRRRRR